MQFNVISSLYLLVFVSVALCFGSFLGLIAVRLPEGGRIVLGRSACRSCGTALGAIDLVPLFSWLALRGRCRHCGAPVSAFYPAMEVAAVGVAVWAAALTSGWLLAASCFLGWGLLVLSAVDWREFLLPDNLTLPLIPAGLVVAYSVDPGQVAAHIAGAALGYGMLALLAWGYRRRCGRDGIGMGDAKLLAAAGAWTSWTALPGILLLAGMTGLVAAVLTALLERRKLSARQSIAFGPHLALATWVSWLYGPITFV